MIQWMDVQQKICRKCIDGDGRGQCRLPVDVSCALRSNFSLIAETIGATHARDYDAYVASLRSSVCARCEDQDERGSCWKRNRLECALDRYYPMVIEIVEHQTVKVQ